MDRVLRKRIPRGFKANLWRWLALFSMTVLGMFVVVSVVGGAENIMAGSRGCAEKNHVEDGEFTTFIPLTKEQEAVLRQKGVTLEQKFSVDIELEDGSVLRFMKNREEINLIAADEGRPAEKSGEVLLEKRYCQEHHYAVGDKIPIHGREFEIVGIGTTPDYDLPVRSPSDVSAESFSFGTAFVTAPQYEELLMEGAGGVGYTYAYLLPNDMAHSDVKQEVKDFCTAFVAAEDNPRILAAAKDMVMNKVMGLIAGAAVMALFAYVISVFVIHQINREASVIGTLYALGTKKSSLLAHYITLPVMTALFGGVSGMVLGFSGLGMAQQMKESYGYFSVPAFPMIYPGYLILYAALMPPAISASVNFLVINRRLSQTALSLIRNERKHLSVRRLKLGNGSFTRNFCIRQMLKELRTSLAVIGGMFLSMMIFMLGLNCFVLCRNVRIDNENSVKFEYMYLLEFPGENVPQGGEACYVQPLSITKSGFCLDVSLIGIEEDSRFFDARPTGGKDSVIIGNSVATKYGLGRGDQLILSDKADERDYVFSVEEICGYSVGLTVFMDIESMRELFGKTDDFYNVVLADHPLAMEESRIYSITTRAGIERSSAVFTEMMTPMVRMLLSVSVIVFFAVMYLMTGVMIDRAGFGISLLKIFGFRLKEIRVLYLSGNAVTAAVGAAFCIPLSKAATDALYPWAVANVACGMNLQFDWYYYPLIFAGVMLVCFAASMLLGRKINRITPSEVLKNRE